MTGTSKRGFALMAPDRHRAIAAQGGRAVPADKRSFSQSRTLAAEAGRKGGLATAPGNEIAGRKAGTRVAVGWDHPLLTFFFQVYDESSKREGPTVWRGASLRELYDIDDLKRAIRKHADLPHDLAVKLYGDRDEGR